MEALGNLKNIRLYPTGRTLKRPGGRFECFREAWHLLKQQKEETEDSQEMSEMQSEANDADVHTLAMSR